MTQEQLNNCIAEDLNKWQPILGFGRIYLDEDNKFSRIHGNLNEDWVIRAKYLANKRLQLLNKTYMSKDIIQTATSTQPKGSQDRENPTPVNTLSKNLIKRG